MNVDNFKAEERPDDMLDDIFMKQHELALKYLTIEEGNGLLQTKAIPVDINSSAGQARIKDMFWRCTEELMEAMEAYEKKEETHFYEEIADAMHFLVEAFILADMYPYLNKSTNGSDNLETLFNIMAYRLSSPVSFPVIFETNLRLLLQKFTQQIGLAANCLKNKPWKQTHMVTDEERFTEMMNASFYAFIRFCKTAGFNAEGLYNMYVRKHQVNQFRQGSGY
jgi:dimeric dUTPase (all-alpha-NTP-PPase superfamily)